MQSYHVLHNFILKICAFFMSKQFIPWLTAQRNNSMMIGVNASSQTEQNILAKNVQPSFFDIVPFQQSVFSTPLIK